MQVKPHAMNVIAEYIAVIGFALRFGLAQVVHRNVVIFLAISLKEISCSFPKKTKQLFAKKEETFRRIIISYIGCGSQPSSVSIK